MNIGDTIDKKFLIIEDLDEGGMGHVYKVLDGTNELALKVCSYTDDESLKRFEREVRIMQNIKHKHVLEVIDFNFSVIPYYFTMPLCKFSLNKMIKDLKEDHKKALQLLIDGCRGIEAIHTSGNIHRDIKPNNFLIDQNNVIKVSDLGLGKFIERDTTTLTESHQTMGTYGFIPPEFYLSNGTKDADYKSDIFQLGKTIYVVLTGRSPFYLTSTGISGGIYYIINKATSQLPENRYESAIELRVALEYYLKSLDESADPEKVFDEHLQKIKQDKFNLTNETASWLLPILYEYKEKPDLFVKLFHYIPTRFLKNFIAKDDMLCTSILSLYEPIIEDYFRNYSSEFEDADKIAASMEAIFTGSNDIQNKTQALKITLIAAVQKNRWDAMDITKEMIEEIKNNEEARVVSEMLQTKMNLKQS